MPTETHHYSAEKEPSPAHPRDEAGPAGGAGNQGSFRDSARQEGHKLKEDVKERARETQDQFRHQVDSTMSEQRARFSDVIRGYGDAARAAAEKMHDDEYPIGEDYLGRLADTCDQAGDYLENRSLHDMTDDASNFVRRHPGISFGLAFAAGFAISRVLQAHPEPSYSTGNEGDWSHDPETAPLGGAYEPETATEWRTDPAAPQRPMTAPDPATSPSGVETPRKL